MFSLIRHYLICTYNGASQTLHLHNFYVSVKMFLTYSNQENLSEGMKRERLLYMAMENKIVQSFWKSI